MDLTQDHLTRRLKDTERDIAANLQYWAEQFSKVDEGTFRVSQTLPAGKLIAEKLDTALRQRIMHICNNKEEALHLFILSCFALLISKCTGRNRLIIGTYDFRKPENKTILPVFIPMPLDNSFKELLMTVRQQYGEALMHGDVSWDSLFNKALVQHNGEIFSGFYGPDHQDRLSSYIRRAPLLFNTDLREDDISLQLYYGDDLNIHPEACLNYFVHMIGRIAEDPSILCRHIPVFDVPLVLQVQADGNDRVDLSPGNETEKDIQETWHGILGKYIGMNNHFVNEGGDSVKAIQFCSRLIAQGYKVTVRDVFAHPTITGLAEYLRQVIAQEASEDSMGAIQGPIPLSPIQKIFFNLQLAEPWHFNQAAILALKTSWSSDAITSICSVLFQHHDALRISFEKDRDGYTQINQPWPVRLEVNTYDYRNEPDAAIRIRNASARNQTSLQLDRAPLARLDHYRTREGDFLGIIIHHLIVDAVSWGILLEDMDRLLSNYPDGERLLPSKTTSWKTWCTCLPQSAPTPISGNAATRMRVPRIASTMENTVRHSAKVSFSLDAHLSHILDRDIHRRYRTTAQDFLLAALAQAIFQIWDMPAISIDIETHGRQAVQGLDVSRTIGWFTGIYPLLIDKADRTDPETLIIHTKEAVRNGQRQALDHILSYIDTDKMDRAGILFNYLGTTANRQYSSFAWSGITPGPTQSPLMERSHDWEINALITEGKLFVNLHYCSGHFSMDQMEQLMSTTQDNLIDLINTFSRIQTPILTPSDLIAGRLPLPELLAWQRERPIEDIYPLTPMQEGMYYHSLVYREAGFYSTQLGYTLKGSLRTDLLKQAFGELMKRHTGLRGSIVQDKAGRPWQVISPASEPHFMIEDITSLDSLHAREYIQSFKERERKTGFDLAKDLLIRIRIFALGDGEYYFLWSYHHIIMDGWCMSVLLSEWMKLYRYAIEDTRQDLPPAAPYRNYIAWLAKKDMEASYTYWQDLLKGYSGNGARLPNAGLAATQIDQTKRARRSLPFDKQRTRSIKELSAKFNVTLYVLIQGIWSIILHRYTHCADLVFGTVVSGRPGDLAGVESIVGLFINNIPVRVQIGEDQLFSDLLWHLQEQSIDSEAHQYCSLAEIQSRLPGTPALVDHILLFENFPIDEGLEHTNRNLPGKDAFRVTDADAFDINNYSFTLVILPGETMQIRIDFNPLVHPETIVDHILVYFDEIFNRLVAGGDQQVALLGVIPGSLGMSLLKEGQTLALTMEEPLTMVEQFEQAVARFGGHPALSDADGMLTYAELDQRAEQLAHLLRRDHSAGPGQVIGLHVERSALAFVGILGILKAGAVYTPIDPGWPIERKQYIIGDAAIKVIITLVGHLPDLAGLDCKVLALDLLPDVAQGSYHDRRIDPDAPAYLIYTSGSTGRPKGVKIKHRSNVSMALSQIRMFDIHHGDRILQFAPLFFDASIYEWSIALYAGASLYIPDERTIRSPDLFSAYLATHAISMMTLPPPFFDLLPLQHMVWPRVVVLAGSSPDLLKTIDASSYAQVYNAYGPTECAVCIAIHRVREDDRRLTALPIGRPLPGNSIYLLDEQGGLVPMGAEGEICIAGVHVGIGYTGNPADHKGKFADDPFHPGETIYRTGDMGRWLPGYELDFKGRKDRQIKVRGYRIEPGEVEAAIKKLTYIDQVVVGEEQDETGLNRLVAWIVSTSDWSERIIRQQLLTYLPAYMIPDTLIPVTAIPLTPNGKVDHNLLKELVSQNRQTAPLVAPTGGIECRLYDIWRSVLLKDQFGIHDKFFEIGGNSLSLIRMHAQLKAFYPEIAITDIFNYNTIAEMAAYIASFRETGHLDRTAGIPCKNSHQIDTAGAQQFGSQQLDISKAEWEMVRNALTLSFPGIMDAEMLMTLFCFALYEHTGSSQINMVLLDDTGALFKEVLTTDLGLFDSREELISHITTANRSIQAITENYPLNRVRFSKEKDAIIVAFSFDNRNDSATILSDGIDIILKSCIARNGDLKMFLVWRKMTISEVFAEELLTRLIHITHNLVNLNN